MPAANTRTPHAHAAPAFTSEDIAALLSLAAVPFSEGAQTLLLEIANDHGLATVCQVIKRSEAAHIIELEHIDSDELNRIAWSLCGA